MKEEINKTAYSTKIDSSLLSFNDIKEAIELLPPKPDREIEKIEFCKKHWNMFKESNNVLTKTLSQFEGIMGSLVGVPIIIKPYIKKVKVYWKTN